MTEETLSNLLKEDRRFEPPADLAENANLKEEAYERAAADREGFWAEQAERLTWEQKWDRVLDWDDAPFAKWFVGGRINAAYNCVDRHVEAGNGDRVALHWVGEPEDDTRDLTYAELKDEVSKAANALTDLGVAAGDRVAIYMPMIPEAIVAMLACARIGAPHTVVFGGFSSDALATRLVDCQAKVVVTSDGGYRRGSASALKPAVDEARAKSAIERPRRSRRCWSYDAPARTWVKTGGMTMLTSGGTTPSTARPPSTRPEAFDAEHPLYVMYTSGTHRQAEGHPAHHRRLPGGSGVHPLGGVRPEAGDRRLLVHRRHRLGHRPQLHRLRTASQRRHSGALRGHAGQPGARPLVEDHPGLQGLALLHRPDGDPLVHEAGAGGPGQVRHVLAAAARLGRRADQPGGLRLVPARHRRRPHPGRRHLVADRDRRDHDQPAARRHPRQAGLGDDPDPRRRRRRGHRGGRVGAERVRRLPGADRAVALDAAHHLGRRRALPRRPTGRSTPSRAGTSPATAPRRTPTATCGCSAGSTTS